MYPVVTRAYEAGSEQDTTNQGGANLAVGVGAGAIAVAVLALGLIALSQQGSTGEMPLLSQRRCMIHKFMWIYPPPWVMNITFLLTPPQAATFRRAFVLHFNWGQTNSGGLAQLTQSSTASTF